jgi:aminocarboxymuconate-semialdehyde decarboxylase
MKIDVHTHILPDKWPDLCARYGYDGFIRLDHHKPCCARMMQGDKFFREIRDNCWSPGRRIEECGEVGEFPKQFVGLGTLPMQAPDLAIGELERCVGELGLCGVQIGSHVNDWNLDQPELFPIFERAAELGAAVFVHPWDMLGRERMERYWLPWLVGMPTETTVAICSILFGGVLERLPNLRIGFAHGGGGFPGTIGRIEHGFNVRPDLCATACDKNPRSYLGQFYVDSLVHDADALRHLVSLMGADRVALGSDYPFPLGEAEPGRLIESLDGFDAETKDRLLWRTALEFLGLKRDELDP